MTDASRKRVDRFIHWFIRSDYFDKIEAWHDKNGSLFQQIG